MVHAWRARGVGIAGAVAVGIAVPSVGPFRTGAGRRSPDACAGGLAVGYALCRLATCALGAGYAAESADAGVLHRAESVGASAHGFWRYASLVAAGGVSSLVLCRGDAGGGTLVCLDARAFPRLGL